MKAKKKSLRFEEELKMIKSHNSSLNVFIFHSKSRENWAPV